MWRPREDPWKLVHNFSVGHTMYRRWRNGGCGRMAALDSTLSFFNRDTRVYGDPSKDSPLAANRVASLSACPRLYVTQAEVPRA